MTEVLRSAIAEVEQYSRVKLVPPIDGTLRGHAVADVIHLLAELVENATVFSAPHTQVLLRAQHVTAGLAVEVEDRGLGMPRDEQNRMNALLADPDQVNVAQLLQDGRIGLFVVSALARRHGIAVRLQTNIYGGIQAVLVLPQGLLGAEPEDAAQPTPPGTAPPAPGRDAAGPGAAAHPGPRHALAAPAAPLPAPAAAAAPQPPPQRHRRTPVRRAVPTPYAAERVADRAQPGSAPARRQRSARAGTSAAAVPRHGGGRPPRPRPRHHGRAPNCPSAAARNTSSRSCGTPPRPARTTTDAAPRPGPDGGLPAGHRAGRGHEPVADAPRPTPAATRHHPKE